MRWALLIVILFLGCSDNYIQQPMSGYKFKAGDRVVFVINKQPAQVVYWEADILQSRLANHYCVRTIDSFNNIQTIENVQEFEIEKENETNH